MKRVHILTFHNALNYGAVLQCIALYKTISQITECDVINYHSPKIDEVYKVFSFKRSLKNNVKGILLVLKTRCKKKKFNNFLNDYVNLTKRYFNFNELKNEHWDEKDIFCCGSDQVWNLDLTNSDEIYFLSFAPKNTTKMSYAASIGKELSDSEKPFFYMKLKEFDFISVREESAKNKFHEIGIECIQYIDPVYLLNKNELEKMSIEIPEEQQPFVLVYLLQKSEKFMKKALDYSKTENKRLIVITAIEFKKFSNVTYIDKCGPREFIRYFIKADIIFTNSFHGISLSIILNKTFFFEYLAVKFKTNSRLHDIITFFNLEILDSDRYDAIPKVISIDFNEVNNKIKKEQDRSIKYLKEAFEHRSISK